MKPSDIVPALNSNENKKPEDTLASPSPQDRFRNAKAAKILEVCKWKDIDALRRLATEDEGLVSDDVRRQACSCH